MAASNWLSGAVYSISVNGLILLYSQMSSTKEAFGVGSGLAEAVAPPPKIPVELAPEEGAALEEEAVTEALQEEAPATEAPQEEAPATEAESDAPDPSMVTGAAALTRDLSYVEGIGDVYSGKLKEAGIDTPQALLERGATPKGRKELAETTGISEHMILKWVDAVDLYRIKGLGTQYSELLEATGVSTVLELAQRNPEHLYAKIIEVNEEHRHVKHAPSQSQIENWVNQAKELPRVVSY